MRLSTQKLRRQTYQNEKLHYTGPKNTEPVEIFLISYDENSYLKKRIADLAHLNDEVRLSGNKWINVDGVHDVEIIESIGIQFGVHFMVLEDIVEVDQRPKMEDYDNQIYVTVKMLYLDAEEEKIVSEQISFLLFEDTLITFQERVGDFFNPIRNKIFNNKGRIRKMGVDYLMYVLMDAIVDNYFHILEEMGEEIAGMEKNALLDPSSEVLQEIYDFKTDIIFLRQSILPIREVINKLLKEESSLFQDSLEPYLRDLLDHSNQVIDSIKTYSDTITGILEIYSSSSSNMLNKEMRRLSMITAVFMPLSFLAGVGGMSEWSMMTGSENWVISYPVFLGISLVVAVLTYIFLKKTNQVSKK